MRVWADMSVGGGVKWLAILLGGMLLGRGDAGALDCDQKGWIEEQRAKNDVEDPFADPFDNEEEKRVVPKFKTTGGFEVEPWERSWRSVRKENWPEIPAPKTFSSSFYEPIGVWRNEGGYFASFNAGEFGAGLFYADKNASAWTRVMRAHVTSLYHFDEDVCIAVGGLQHMGLDRGEIYRVAREADGSVSSRLLFRSKAGKAKMIGLSKTQMYSGDVISERLAVFVLCSYYREVEQIFGVTADGVIYALGARVIAEEKGED